MLPSFLLLASCGATVGVVLEYEELAIEPTWHYANHQYSSTNNTHTRHDSHPLLFSFVYLSQFHNFNLLCVHRFHSSSFIPSFYRSSTRSVCRAHALFFTPLALWACSQNDGESSTL